MRRKCCRSCHQLYTPHPQTYRQQKTCSKAYCRRWRLHQKWQRWSMKNPLYAESRQGKLKEWRHLHRDYWGRWRKDHTEYVKENRRKQKRRDARRRGNLAKPTEWNTHCSEKIARIRSLRDLAKPTESIPILFRQVDGICDYLGKQLYLAKPTAIDTRR